MRPVSHFLALSCAIILTHGSGAAQNPTTPAFVPSYSYADLADLALASSITAHVKVKSAKKLPPALSAGLLAGYVRHLVTADVIGLVRGDDGLAPRISYLIDLPSDSRGKVAKINKTESFIFAVPGRPGEVRLVAPDAQIPWSAQTGQRIRAILSEVVRTDAPPPVKGIVSGFHSAGTLSDEGETQIFLTAAEERPVSLTIIRQPNSAPRWSVSLGEIVDDGVIVPQANTILWYRLACFLPATVPDTAVSELPENDAAAVREDYAFVMTALGPCPRMRKKR